jgi:hypothetical protein
MSGRDHSSGGLTGATGDLTPDDIQRDFEPGELREASDAAHQGEVTRTQTSSHAHEPHAPPAETSETDRPATEAGEEPAVRELHEPQIGGDARADHEEHL